MRSLSAGVLAALAQRRLVARDFLWLIARNRSTGAPVPDGYWSDVGTITVSVIDPETGSSSSRQFFGAGALISISDISLVSNISVHNVTITMSQVADRVNDIVRTYDCKQATVQIFRGLFDPDTRLIVAPAPCRFVGFVDTIDITTPSEGEAGSVVFTCASHTQEMTRGNSDTRSDASQKLRSATDNFFEDAAIVGEWEMRWGAKYGPLQTKKKRD